MPPKPKLRQYREAVLPVGELHPMIRAFLLTGTVPPLDAPDEVRDIVFERGRVERLWRAHKRALLAEGRRGGFSPFGMHLFENVPLPGLPAWRRHRPDPRPLLAHKPVGRCPHCGGREFDRHSCLA